MDPEVKEYLEKNILMTFNSEKEKILYYCEYLASMYPSQKLLVSINPEQDISSLKYIVNDYYYIMKNKGCLY